MLCYDLGFLTLMTNPKTGRAWQVMYAERQKTLKHTLAAIVEQEPLRELKTPILIKITRHSANRPDYDNLISGSKYIIDSLVKLEMIPDDSCEYVCLECSWEYVERNQGFMEVVILEEGDK